MVSNALKYAFKNFIHNAEDIISKNKLRIIKMLVKQNTYSMLKITVADNGQGFPDNINFKESPSLGLNLVNSLIEQLDGTISLKNTPGAEFEIIFNIK